MIAGWFVGINLANNDPVAAFLEHDEPDRNRQIAECDGIANVDAAYQGSTVFGGNV